MAKQSRFAFEDRQKRLMSEQRGVLSVSMSIMASTALPRWTQPSEGEVRPSDHRDG